MEGITGGNMFIWDLERNKLEEVVLEEKVFAMNAQLVEVAGEEEEAVLFCGYSLEKGIQRGLLHCLNRNTHIYLLKQQGLVLRTVTKQQQQQQQHQSSDLAGGRLTHQYSNWKPILHPLHNKLVFLTGGTKKHTLTTTSCRRWTWKRRRAKCKYQEGSSSVGSVGFSIKCRICGGVQMGREC